MSVKKYAVTSYVRLSIRSPAVFHLGISSWGGSGHSKGRGIIGSILGWGQFGGGGGGGGGRRS